MRNGEVIEDVRRRLLRKGFGRAYANRAALELREHWLDLAEEGERQGLARTDAEVQATERLGTAEKLTAEMCARLQPVSWMGRNPTVAFAGLALLGTFVWWLTLMIAAGGAAGFFAWDSEVGGIPPAMDRFRMLVDWIRGGSYVAVPWMICVVAKQYFCGWKPALWGCLLTSIHNGAHSFKIDGEPGHGSIGWGYEFSFEGPDLLPVLAPLCVFAIFWAWNLRAVSEADSKERELCA